MATKPHCNTRLFPGRPAKRPRKTCPNLTGVVESSGSVVRIVWVPCRRKSCPVCRMDWERERVRHYAGLAEAAAGLWETVTTTDGWHKIVRRIRRAGGDYLRSVALGEVRILSTVPVQGSVEVPPGGRLEAVSRLVGRSAPRTQLSSSKAWQPPRAPERAGREDGWTRVGTTRATAHEILARLGRLDIDFWTGWEHRRLAVYLDTAHTGWRGPVSLLQVLSGAVPGYEEPDHGCRAVRIRAGPQPITA